MAWLYPISAFLAGFSSIVTQIVILRELMGLFSGNELVVGIALGSWLILTGLGSYLGRLVKRPSATLVSALLIILALIPPFQIAAIRLFRAVSPGVAFGVHEAFLGSFAVLLPYGIACGLALTVLSHLLSVSENRIGLVYVLDTLGGVVGGLLFSFVLIHFFSPFAIVTILLTVLLVIASAILFISERSIAAAITFSAIGLSLLLVFLLKPEVSTLQKSLPSGTLIESRFTPYGNIALAKDNEQFVIFDHGTPIATTNDIATAEQTVHFALSQRLGHERVLLVSGGLTGALSEILKYRSITTVDYLELDPAIIDLSKKLYPSLDKVNFIAQDARAFIRSKENVYDAILLALPDPTTSQLNRYYTVEFFALAKRALRGGGVLSTRISGAANYFNPQSRALSSSVYQSIRSIFPEVLIVPGAQLYLLASDRPLSFQFSRRLIDAQVRTRYVTDAYLSATLTPDRIRQVERVVNEPATLNRDFFPVTYYAQLKFWLSQFQGSLVFPVIAVFGLFLLLVALILRHPRSSVGAALSATGFSGMGLQMVILITFQLSYGSLYGKLGVVIAFFLLGSAIGALAAARVKQHAGAWFFIFDLLVAGLALILASGISTTTESLSVVVFLIANGVTGFLVGAQFPVAAALFARDETILKSAGSLYAFDLLGAALGAMVAGSLLIPWLGIRGTCYFFATLKGLTSLLLILRRSESPNSSNRSAFRFTITTFVFVSLGVLALFDDTSTTLYAWSFVPSVHWLLIALMAWGILSAMDVIPKPKFLGHGAYQWLCFFAFSLVVFVPVFRCYFKIPYLFCHVCPRKCAFGFLRPYLIPAALIMNIEKRHWCYHGCPVGTLYAAQERLKTPSRRWAFVLWVSALAVLTFIVFAYFRVRRDFEQGLSSGTDWYTHFFNNQYATSVTVVGIALVLIVGSFWIPRLFCRGLCPLGNCSELILKLEKTISKERAYEHA